MSNDLSPGGASSLNAAQILAKLTGATALAAGAMLFGAGTASLTTLPAGTNGYVLTMAAGVPSWAISPGAALPASYAIGDTLYASSTSALSRLAAVAVGQVLISAGVGIAPAWSASPSVTGIITAKPTTTAGIALDPNAATGNFTLSLSPANITAARRWSFPDRSDTVAGLGAQTFTGAQTVNGTITGLLGLVILGGTLGGPANLELGNVSGTATTPYIDFNTSATAVDYNVRLIASGAASGLGAGTLTAFTSALIVNVDPGGSELLRVGGSMRANGLSVFTGGILSDGGGAEFRRSGSAAAYRGYTFETAGVQRWYVSVSGGTESGSNAGSNYEIRRYSDGGTDIGTVLSISRASGLISTFGNISIAGGISNSLGTITTAQQAIDSSVTWNSGATAFTGWKLNVTDTASAAGSLLLDLQVGGVSKFSVRKDGLVTSSGRALSGVIYVADEDAGTGPVNTSSETSIISVGGSPFGSLTVPANFFTASKVIKITITGVIGVSGTDTLFITGRLGSTIVFPDGGYTVTGLAGHMFQIEMFIYCRTAGVSGVFSYSGKVNIQQFSALAAAQSFSSKGANGTPVTVNTTVSLAIGVTARWGTANPVSTMKSYMTLIEVLN